MNATHEICIPKEWSQCSIHFDTVNGIDYFLYISPPSSYQLLTQKFFWAVIEDRIYRTEQLQHTVMCDWLGEYDEPDYKLIEFARANGDEVEDNFYLKKASSVIEAINKAVKEKANGNRLDSNIK